MNAMYAALNLGMGLLAAGLVSVLLVWAALRFLPRIQASAQPVPRAQDFVDASPSVDAVLIVEPGGRLEYLNQPARTYFGLHENEPLDLEHLAQRVRSSADFLSVCVAPGQKSVLVNNRLVEATSYRVPGSYPLMLVALRAVDLSPAVTRGEEFAGTVLKVITGFSQAITASLDLETTIQSILENVSRLVPSDLMELKIWDEENQTMIPYRLQEAGLRPAHRREETIPRSSWEYLAVRKGRDGDIGTLIRAERSHFGVLTEQLVSRQVPVLIEIISTSANITDRAETLKVRSYLGMPLLVGGELIGLLEAGHIGVRSFTQKDLDLLKLVSGQASAAIRNAKLYKGAQRRAAELAGFSQINQSFGTFQDLKDLFTRLVDGIAPLFETEILGFLLYDEEKRILEGQVPFRGLPEHFVEIYRTSIPAGSPAEMVLIKQQPILTLDAANDEEWRSLGLNDIAVAASLRDSALIPMVASGRMLGYFQVAHHRSGVTSFTPDEVRLMERIANQAAASIENLLLVQQAKTRSQRAEALQTIANLSTSSLALEDVLDSSVKELAQLFQAEVGALVLLDESRGELNLNRKAVFGIPEQVANAFTPIFVDDPDFRASVTGSRQPFLSGRLSTNRRLEPVIRSLATTLQIQSVLIVPLIVRNRSLGELILGSSKEAFYDNSDLQVLSSAASQLAAAIESAGLITQTDDSLRQNVEQLTAFTRVSRELGASLDVKHLLEVIHAEGLQASGAECGSTLLFDPESPATTPRVSLSNGCMEYQEFSVVERAALQRGEPLVIPDYSRISQLPAHPGIRSALLVPILHQGRALGAIHLHARQPGFFTADLTELVQTLAAQASTALINAQRFEDERLRSESHRRRADTLGKLATVSYSLDYNQPLEQTLQAIAAGICDSTPFRVVLVSLYEPVTGMLRRVSAVGISQETLKELKARKQPLASIQQLMQPKFKISHSFFIPADQTPILPADVHYVYSTYDRQEPATPQNAWDPDDFLLLPLEDAEGKPLGLISLDDPSNGLRPDRATIESIEVFAAQAALVISNARQVNDLRERLDAISSGLQRQQKLLSITQNDLPVLLRKDLEQTISLHNLDRRAQRVRASLAITGSVSRQLDAASALLALGRETLTQLGMSAALMAEHGPEGPRLLHILGNVPRSTNVEALFGQRNPLRACLLSGRAVLISNLEESDEWRDTPLLNSLRAKAVICLPVNVENKPVAAMLAISPEPMDAFSDEDRQVYFQIARQASIILQNISLLNETRRRLQEVNLLLDFSRHLSGLDPDGILRALLESSRRVLHAAHAGVVLVWNQQTELLMPRAIAGYADDDAMTRISYRSGEALPGITFSEMKPRRVDEINFARDYGLRAENLSLYRQAVGGRFPVSSLLVPVIFGDQAVGLLVLDNFNTSGAFKPEDEALLISLTQQVALSLEHERLIHATRERAGQLQALNEVAASLTSSLRSDQLISSLLDQLTPILPYDTAVLWLRDKEQLRVAASRGFPDTERRLGLTMDVSDSALFTQMMQTGEAILVGDLREDKRFPRQEAPHLSWLGIPLIYKGELAGVIALEKWQANYYSQEQLQVGVTFASQAAVALENARLYEDSLSRATELDQRSQRLALLNRFSSSLSGLLDADQILQLTAEQLQQAVGARRVSVVTFDRGKAYWRFATPRVRYKLPRVLPEAPIFARMRESLEVFNTENARKEADLSPLSEILGAKTTALMILPIASSETLNALFIADGTGAARFSVNEIELARTIINQAAIALEKARLYQSTLQTAERLAILNETSAQVSAQLDPDEIYVAVHKAAQRLMPAETFVISMLDETTNEIEGVYVVDENVRSPSMRIPKDKGLSGRVIASGQPLLLQNPEMVESAGGIPFGKPEAPLSVLAVPMTLGARTRGMLSAQSHLPNVYTQEDQQILGTLANQAIVAIQNARLFAETQRLAEELEARVIERTAQLQREQQNTETLLRILTEVSSSLDLDRTLNRTLSLLNDATGAQQGTIMLLEAEGNLLHYRAGYGYLSEQPPSPNRDLTLKVGEGLAGWVVHNRQGVLIGDLHQDARWVQIDTSQDHRSAIVVPMMVGEDVIGVLMVFHRSLNFFSTEMMNLVNAIAGQVTVAINNARLYELIRDQAERLSVMLRKEQEDASRSQAILQAVADGVLVTGPHNRITFINSSTERILALDGSSVLDNSVDSIGGLLGKAASTWMETIHRWSEDPASQLMGDTYAEQLELENGRIALVHLAPVILQNDFLGTVSIFRDITSEVEVDRLKSEFVATVSHELRTPMTSVKGYVDLLKMSAAGALNENQAHFVEIVSRNIERLNVLLDDLLDVSRLESGRVTLSYDAVDLRQLAEQVVAEARSRSQKENKPMELTLEAPKNLPSVNGDKERIHQILGNLVENAYSYTPGNGTISIRMHPVKETEVQVDVQDNGVGIPADEQNRIFERFYRGEDPLVLATPGTGLGLSIVHQLVEMHNGRIWMNSSGVPGEGSTFSFTLPVHKSKRETTRRAASHKKDIEN